MYVNVSIVQVISSHTQTNRETDVKSVKEILGLHFSHA